MGLFRYALLALLCLALLSPSITSVHADETVKSDAGNAPASDLSAEDLAAEEAAARAVGEQAEDEGDEEGGDAMDEDADSARPHPDRHPLSLLPPAARDVTVGHAFLTGFPTRSDKTATLGEKVRVLLALANGGRTLVHVWGVCGSLNDASRYGVHVQNFTYHMVNTTVSSGGELSMSYEFTPNERLDTRPFRLALTVFYEAQSADGSALRGHSSTFYNETLATRAGPQSVSNGAFLVLTGLFVAACAAGIAFLFAPTAEQDKKTTAAAPADAATESGSGDWLAEHLTTMQSGGGRASSSKVTKRR